ncbi:hypothetical protein NKV53_08095 [Legionella sp. 27cVA30]|nr:hypothetical protein [Legionella sp. 27cVA30]MCP0914298.1 hypothetical protein [Legionella sp. 27cVA30]
MHFSYMDILHKKAAALSQSEWEHIRLLNQKITPRSLFDQDLFNGGCLKSTCDNAINKAIETGTTEVLLGWQHGMLISYMIFYCKDNPLSLQSRLAAYEHLGQVGYSDMLVVEPHFQRLGFAASMRRRMKHIAREAKVDVFMTFVRSLPIPNIPSLLSLRKAGAVCGKNLLALERCLKGMQEPGSDVFLEMVYPTDERKLTVDQTGKIMWQA